MHNMLAKHTKLYKQEVELMPVSNKYEILNCGKTGNIAQIFSDHFSMLVKLHA